MRAISMLVLVLLGVLLMSGCLFTKGVDESGRTSDEIMVKLMDQTIVATLGREAASVVCKYILYNEGETVTAQLGFPNFYNNEQWGEKPFYNFTVKVNGEEKFNSASTETTQNQAEKVLASVTNRNWHVWQVFFPSKAATVIEISYECSYIDNQGVLSLAYPFGTGGSWHGPIKTGKIVIDHGGYISRDWILTTEDGAEVPDYFKVTKEYDQAIYAFENVEPAPEDEFVFKFISPWMDDRVKLYEAVSGIKDRKRLARMRNEIFARHGYVFKSTSYRDLFNSQPWYKKNPRFSPKSLTLEETSLVNKLVGLEKSTQQ